MPYIKGLNEKFSNTCNKADIQVHFKGHNIIWTLHMAPKVKVHMCQKCGVIYHYKHSNLDCPEQYLGELGKTFGGRFR